MLESVRIVAEVGPRSDDEVGLRCTAGDELGVSMQPLSQLGEMSCDISEDAEVDQRELFWSAAADLVESGVPGFDIDVGRRCRWDDAEGRIDAYAGSVACEQEPVTQVADVVRRMTGAREAAEVEHPLADDLDVLLGDRDERSPEDVECVAV